MTSKPKGGDAEVALRVKRGKAALHEDDTADLKELKFL